MLPREDSVDQIYNTDPIYIYYPWEDSVNQIYNTTLSTYMTWEISVDQICNATLSTYVTKRRLSRSDIQYRPDLHKLPWEDSVDQIYNTDPIYICYNEKIQSIRYTIPTLSTYVTMRRLSQSDIQYRSYLHMLPREDSVNPIYNTDPIYICYHEKTQSIRYTIPTLSTYITHEKTQSIRYTIPTLSTYITMRRLRSSDIQFRPYLHMLPWDDSADQIYNTDFI